jgi:preprotein translocase subunit SecB
MKKEIAGEISFEHYEVTKITYEANEQCDKNEFSMDFDVNSNSFISEDGKLMSVELTVIVKLCGYFENKSNGDIKRYEPNAIAILYPYVRAIVATYTSVANITPVNLPTVNINKMLKNKH